MVLNLERKAATCSFYTCETVTTSIGSKRLIIKPLVELAGERLC